MDVLLISYIYLQSMNIIQSKQMLKIAYVDLRNNYLLPFGIAEWSIRRTDKGHGD